MERQEFRRRYFESKRQCVDLTVPLILESLPSIHMCFIRLTPAERLTEGDARLLRWPEIFRRVGHTCVHAEDEMVDWLSRDDFAPASVELSVYGTTAIHTTFEFLVAGVFARPTSGAAEQQSRAPWIAMPPRMPPEWRSVSESGRFSINWHKKRGDDAA